MQQHFITLWKLLSSLIISISDIKNACEVYYIVQWMKIALVGCVNKWNKNVREQIKLALKSQ